MVLRVWILLDLKIHSRNLDRISNSSMNPTLVYDIETEDWDRFVLGTVYDGHRSEIYRWPDGEEGLFRRISETPGEVWAHNGGRFDHLWYLDTGRRLGTIHNARVTLSGLGIVSIKVGETILLDSYRVFPLSLATLTGGAKRSLDDLCTCGRKCGGYCTIRRDMPPQVRARVEEYAVADVVELWKALDHFSAFAQKINVPIGWTVAGTAWRSALEELKLPRTPHRTTARWAAVRRGYYGGRDEIYRIISRHGERHDVNATYPAALATTPVPVGKARTLWWQSAGEAWKAGKPGVYTARVKVPAVHSPPLPTRGSKTGRLIFPTGVFPGTWARPELEHALACGTEIVEWIDAIVWDGAEILFKPWVERLYAIRLANGKKTREGEWIKYILNSLTGRLGTRCEVSAVVIDPDTVRGHRPECHGGVTCTGVCGAHRLISMPGSVPVYSATALRIQAYAHPAWAAYLTGASRVKLHRRLTPDVAYCATDSCYSERSMTRDVGTGLGQWLHEGPYTDFHAIAPKVYRYHDGKTWIMRAKGIPLSPETWDKIERGERIHYMSRASIRRPADDGSFFHKIPASRLVTPNTGARILIPGTVLTRAPKYEEVADL